MRSFRLALALRSALSTLALFALFGLASILALRSILYRQLDGTLLHIAEVEAQAGAATTGPEFQFHEGVLLATRESPVAELTRYAQLWTSEGVPLARSRNLSENLPLPRNSLPAAQRGEVVWATHVWRGRELRCVIYPLKLVGAAHVGHLLQIAAPMEPVQKTLAEFTWLVVSLTLVAGLTAGVVGWRLAGVALRPTAEITAQAEAIEAGTLSARITAHADVREFGRLVTVLNAMLDRIQRAFETQRRFTADASHELRAPLTALRGEIDVTLKRERSPEEYRATLERCREEVIRLSRLGSDLLVLARSESGERMEQPQEIDLRGLVDRVVQRYQPLAASRGLRIEVSGAGAVAAGDPQLLEQVVINVLDNAVKYTPEGGRIDIELSGGEAATMTVRDTGPGVAPADAPHLFERFFRADPARSGGESTGLG
ncbi:MAG: ATP-binding protein, partial [Gemmatimonadales bacterium]